MELISSSQEELNGTIVDEDAWATSVFYSSLILVGCILAKRPVNWDSFAALVMELWSPTLGLEMPKNGVNHFLFYFSSPKRLNVCSVRGPVEF